MQDATPEERLAAEEIDWPGAPTARRRRIVKKRAPVPSCKDTMALPGKCVPMADETKALLMLSGGPDSATLASLVHRELPAGAKAAAVYLRSGDPADERQIEAANRILGRIDCRFDVIVIAEFLSALHADPVMWQRAAPFLPFRGTVALSVMTLYAIKSRAAAVYVGLHRADVEEREDYARHSIDRLEALAAAGGKNAPKIMTPFLDMTKAEVFKLGASMDVPYELTWSCARADAIHCGECGSCRARRRAFVDAGRVDPTRYRRSPA